MTLITEIIDLYKEDLSLSICSITITSFTHTPCLSDSPFGDDLPLYLLRSSANTETVYPQHNTGDPVLAHQSVTTEDLHALVCSASDKFGAEESRH
jgi:hypothetical protein